MSRFSRVLRRVERRLEAPEPERSRILMELAGDLEDLYRTYRERGLDEAAARRKAERWLAPSAATLESLRAVHLPTFDRLLDRLGGTTRGRVELGLAALVSLAAVGAGAFAALRSGVLAASAPTLWVTAGLVALGLGLGVREAYSLFVRGDRLGPGWRAGSHRVLAAAVAAALAGVLGGGVRLTLTAGPGQGGGTAAAFWSEVSTATGVAALSLSASLLLALLWLLLRVRAEVVATARRELRERVPSFDDESTRPKREVARC